MRDMLTKEEAEALRVIDKEVETGETKIRGLVTKFSENVDNISKAKEEIHCLLGQSQTLAFLQTSFNLPQAVSYDPYTPRINLDSKKVVQSEAFTLTLKNYLMELFKHPVEARIPKLIADGTVLNFDPRTAHKRIELSENLTKASVSDEHTNYPDCLERFAVCSQVLASKGFSVGRHYWEVRLSSNNFIGVGLAYRSIDRKGPTSRLGRNDKSWCVEWFNVKLSAWHNSSETVLANPNPKRVGVLLDCEEGKATFYNVADRAYPFHSFSFQFAEAVYPAFWIFSSGSCITMCKLQ
ncbi:hypothetical protein XENOCAPTIV_012648 [Xenoophorus captivus]|uniref:B30.2/SPRY domain-containing protein n=1 Tax=Xenoophorus captivus TaxID=1517983 RepID=A0ABV0R066_9TELE